MKRVSLLLMFSILIMAKTKAQEKMTPELLWSLKRVSANGISPKGNSVYFSEKEIDWKTEKSTIHNFKIDLQSDKISNENYAADYTIIQRDENGWYALDDKGNLCKSNNKAKTWKVLSDATLGADDAKVSPDGKYVAFVKEVLVKPMFGSDIYTDLSKTTAQVYTDLNQRHWDAWEDGKYSHVFIAKTKMGANAKDIMQDEPFDCPQKPHGGSEDFVWHPKSLGLVYVSKKLFGKAYAQSTNTNLYYYQLEDKTTTNLTKNNTGYDQNPQFNEDGTRLAWLSMSRDGFEADKNDICVMDVKNTKVMAHNLTYNWDGEVAGFAWGENGNTIYFNAPEKGTEQLFSVNVPKNLSSNSKSKVQQITKGIFDINGIVSAKNENDIIVTRCDMNHAAELYKVNKIDGTMKQLSHANDAIYATLTPSKTELKMVKTTDGKMMGVWVIYPPNFDASKKYPTLLYCQGGPQSALSQFYSFRWNFALMAANDYIIVAPNRRGMPGWGVKWNEDISGDWGGQPMKDYLSAIDKISEESYVDKNRLGCIGASYGGYSVFMLAGMHNNRFKSFIAHDGLFDLRSWYGTTEELWFANWDLGGAYWNKKNDKTYEKFSPSNFVDKWNTPIMIVQGGIDYRVPIEQGLQAFQAAQLKGIKSKLLYFPNENHWVLHPQNGIAWQREFFKWLEETLK